MKGKEDCGVAGCELTPVVSVFLTRFFWLSLEQGDLQLIFKSWFCSSCFSSSFPRSHQQAKTGLLSTVRAVPSFVLLYVFIDNILLTLPVGPVSFAAGLPKFLKLNEFLRISIWCFKKKKNYSLVSQKSVPVGVHLDSENRARSWGGFRINNETCVQSL